MNPFHPRMLFASLVKIVPAVLDLKNHQCIYLCRSHLPKEVGVALFEQI